MERIRENIQAVFGGYEEDILKLKAKSCSWDKVEDLIEYYKKWIYGWRFALYDFFEDFNFLSENDKNIYIVAYGILMYLDYLVWLKWKIKNTKFDAYLIFDFSDLEFNQQLLPEFIYFIYNNQNKTKLDGKLVENPNEYLNYVEGILRKIWIHKEFHIDVIDIWDWEYSVHLKLNEKY